MVSPQREPIRVFYSYSHRDAKMRARLEVHLSLLKNSGLISQWYDRRIKAGDEWEGEIDANLERAQIILLLVSPDFLASKYCHDIEMKRAMEKHDAGESRVVPIILRPVLWHGETISRLQALPTDAKPVSRWKPQDEGWFDVASGIAKVVNALSEAHTPTLNESTPSVAHETTNMPESAISHDGEDAEDATVLAVESGQLLTASRYDDALELADRALAIDPANVVALHNKAVTLDRLGRQNDAIEVWNRVLPLTTDDAQLWMGFGTTLTNSGRLSEAASAFRKAVKSGPYYADAWYNLGNVLTALERAKDAVDAYQQAVAIKPNFPAAWYNLGYLLHLLGQSEAALAAFEESLRYRPNDAATWRHSSLILSQLGEYEAAVETLSRALALAPADVHSWYLRGYIEATAEAATPPDDDEME